MSQRPVSEVIRNNSFVAIPPTTTVREAAHLMKAHHTSAVLVVDRRHMLKGICTERDLVVHVLAADLDPVRTPVAEVMTHDPVTITPEKPFCHALHRMYEGGFRHVPVVDSVGRPVGMVAARDALQMDAVELEEDLVRREEITVIL
jgi:CBS domain-containing protein